MGDLTVALEVPVDDGIEYAEEVVGVDNFKIITLADEFHDTDSALSILEIVLFYAPEDLFKHMVNQPYDKIAVSFLDSGYEDSDTRHIIKLCVPDQHQ